METKHEDGPNSRNPILDFNAETEPKKNLNCDYESLPVPNLVRYLTLLDNTGEIATDLNRTIHQNLRPHKTQILSPHKPSGHVCTWRGCHTRLAC